MSRNPFLPRPDHDKQSRFNPTPPPPMPPPLQPTAQSSRQLWSPDPSPFRSPTVRTTVAASTLERKLKYATAKLGAYVSDRSANVSGIDPPPEQSEIHSTAPVEVRHIEARPVTPPSPQPPVETLREHRKSPIKSPEIHRRINTVDFVLAYQKHRNKKVSKDVANDKMDDDVQRQRFFGALRSHGILVNVDDDPTCSLDAGRTCFALLRLSQRLLKCKCKCHVVNSNNLNGSEDGQKFETNSKDIDHQQESDDDEYYEKFTSAQRAQIVWRIILRIGKSNKHEPTAWSLEDLLEAGIISAAYPVHDGSVKLENGEDANNINDRRILYEEWARPGLIIPRQWKSDERITDLIRRYYGIPVAVYFSWLRYYTLWLVGPAIAGLLWFIYGFLTTRNDVPTQDICDPRSQVADWILCPTRSCNVNNCGFTRVRDTCSFYRWTSAATFDRPGAVLFAVFMSFWATAFQQLWTSYAGRLTTKHDVSSGCGGDRSKCCADCSAANATAEGERRRTTADAASRTGKPRADVTATAGRPWYSVRLSGALRAVAFLATLAAVAMVPVLIVVYRGRVIGWLMSAVFHQNGGQRTSGGEAAADERRGHHYGFFLLNYANGGGGEQSNWKTAVAALCATFAQLTAIVAVHRGYSAVAEWLTKYSYHSVYDPRFQSRYTAYMSCFDSANYYSSLVYIAFFKGRFVTGREKNIDSSSRWSHFWPISLLRNLIFHIREDVCDPAATGTGCVPELCTQLAIIMVAKQIVDNAIELMTPLTINVWRRWRAKENRRRKKLHGKLPDTIVETLKHPKQWQLDYQLEDTGPLGLYQEYSEMVIQYGFVIMFATAFPLAPLCALLNNILEQRLDAYKMVAAQRRPVPAYYCTSEDMSKSRGWTTASCCNNCIKLGTWIRVLKVLSIISILYNAFMIAFTSDLLPRYVYTQMSSVKSSSLEGYVAWSLSSKRNVSEYYYGKLEDANSPKECRYRGYGEDVELKLDGYKDWQVLAARLVFVIVFEHCVIAATAALAYIIRYTMNRYRKNGRKIFDRRTSNDDYSKPDGFLVSCWSTTTAAALVGANGIATTVGANNREANNHMVLDDSNHGRSMIREDPVSVAPVVVVDMENDDGQVETSIADTYHGLAVPPEAIKAS